MAATVSIKLKDLHFFAAHGVYEEEGKLGNEFEINLTLTFPAPEKAITALDETINYVTVYEIIKEEMHKRRLLLETFAMQVAEQLHQHFPQLKALSISIKKVAPPIAGFSGSIEVIYEKDF